MAYSPSPGPSTLVRTTAQPHRMTPTPPLNQPVTKRDKRRNMIQQGFKDLEARFRTSREGHCKAQLNSISRDISFINRANPYDNKALDDGADEIVAEFTSVVGDLVYGGFRGGALSVNSADSGVRGPSGKWSAKFVEEVNNAMEDRDARLIDLADNYNQQLRDFHEHHDFMIRVAAEEHKILKEAIRERTIASIRNKKKQLSKEKDVLDLADANTLLYNNHHLSITQPASPGGAQSNRKTRHTRHHRLDVDNLEGNGESHKRKRKIQPDIDNGSPVPNARGSFEAEGALLWDSQQSNSTAIPVERSFTTKELAIHTKAAVKNAAMYWSNKRLKENHVNGKSLSGSGLLTNGEVSETEATNGLPQNGNGASEDDVDDDETLAIIAPAMERGGSHLTRSKQNKEDALLSYDPLDGSRHMPQTDFGTAAVLAHSKLNRNREEVGTTESLTSAEQVDDLQYFKAAIAAGKY